MMTKQRLIQLIHIARNDLQMDEDTYRQMLQGLTGKASTKGMDTPQLNRVLESMKNKGFRIKPQASSETVQSRRWRCGLNGKQASARYAGSAMSRQVA